MSNLKHNADNTVGIVVTGFNCKQYLKSSLHSVLAQRDQNWECAIVFNPNENGEVIDNRIRNDARFKLIPSEHINVCAARNLGFSAVTGQLLFSLDGDDLITSDYIVKLRSLMNNPRVAIAYTGTQYFGNFNGLKQEIPFCRRTLAIRNTIVSSAMMRREIFEAVGRYDESFSSGYEDWDLWISMLKNGGDVAFEPEPHFYYRQHSESRSHSITYELESKIKERIFDKHADFCWHAPKNTDRKLH